MTTTTEQKPTIQLRSPRDASLAVVALEQRASELEKLAKKNTEAGYPREGRTQLADASTITAIILPAFRAQQELPLVDVEQTRVSIADALRTLVRGRLTIKITKGQAEQPGEQENLLQSREDYLVEALARRIHAYGLAVAESSYRAGYAAREHEPEVLAHQEVLVLSAAGD